MVDYETLVASLRTAGYTVGDVFRVPKNAGVGELVVNGKTVTVEEARQMLADAQPK